MVEGQITPNVIPLIGRIPSFRSFFCPWVCPSVAGFFFLMLPRCPGRVIEGMNTTSSLKRAVVVALALGAASATAAFADTDSTGTTTSPTPGEGWHHHHHHGASVLTASERAELKKDRESVFASDPALKTQDESLHQQFKALRSQGTSATQAQWQALKQQKEAFHSQLRTAIENVDSGAAALFAKVDAAHTAHQQ
jgi:hypothetical protein